MEAESLRVARGLDEVDNATLATLEKEQSSTSSQQKTSAAVAAVSQSSSSTLIGESPTGSQHFLTDSMSGVDPASPEDSQLHDPDYHAGARRPRYQSPDSRAQSTSPESEDELPLSDGYRQQSGQRSSRSSSSDFRSQLNSLPQVSRINYFEAQDSESDSSPEYPEVFDDSGPPYSPYKPRLLPPGSLPERPSDSSARDQPSGSHPGPSRRMLSFSTERGSDDMSHTSPVFVPDADDNVTVLPHVPDSNIHDFQRGSGSLMVIIFLILHIFICNHILETLFQ
jgi:hypothetical protein